MTSTSFLLTQVAFQSALLYGLQVLLSLRIRHPIRESEPSTDQSDSQFGIKHILLSMTFMAALLAFGRFLYSDLSAGPDFLTELAIIVCAALTAQLTAIILTATFLLDRWTAIATVGAVAITITTAFICGLFAFEIRRQVYRIAIAKR